MINVDTMRTINETKTYDDLHRSMKPKFCWKYGDYLADIERKLHKHPYSTSINARIDFMYYDFGGNSNPYTKWLVINKLRENGYNVRMTDDYDGIYIQW